MDEFLSQLPATVACTAALMAAGTVKGIISLGLPLVGLPLLMFAVDVPTAIGLLMVPLVVSNLIQAIEGPGTLALIRRFWLLLVCLAAGTLVGTRLFAALDRDVLLLTIGPLAIVMATASMLQPNLAIAPRTERWLGPVIGFAAGVIGGMSSLFGPILALYVVGLRLPRDVFVKAIALHYVTAASFLLLGGAAQGWAGPRVLLLSALGMVPVYVGMRIGIRIRKRVDPERFRLAVLCVVWLTGANMVRLGLGY
jgi:hypothetical protein